MAGKYKIVFVRHGESQWNLKNLFCGWYDADLSEAGVKEAEKGGEAVKESGIVFDQAYSSVLLRANRTLELIRWCWSILCADREIVEIERATLRKFDGSGQGGDSRKIWRRSGAGLAPQLRYATTSNGKTNEYYEVIRNDPRYADLKEDEFPSCESLELTIKRTMPFWNDVIVPALKAGKTPLVAAHGNSLRGIVCHLDKMSNEEIMELNLPTGIPFVYELDENFQPVVSMKFLGDEETVAAAIEKVKNQTKRSKNYRED